MTELCANPPRHRLSQQAFLALVPGRKHVTVYSATVASAIMGGKLGQKTAVVIGKCLCVAPMSANSLGQVLALEE